MLDHHIFAKQYFESDGFILAIEESGDETRPLGFVHAGFNVNPEQDDLNLADGIICQLKVVPHDDQGEIAQQLLVRAIDYLKSRGARTAYVGSCFPNAPFYLGLYGGSQVPGVLVDDVASVNALQSFGFVEDDQIVILEKQLIGFRAHVDRSQLALRRQFQINAIADPLEKNWWESCTLGMAERDTFSAFNKREQVVCGQVSFWDMQPLANSWGVLARGLYGLSVNESNRRCGIATYLVGESLKHLMQQGVGLVEAQTRQSDAAAIGVFQKLGFEEVSRGLLMSFPIT